MLFISEGQANVTYLNGLKCFKLHGKLPERPILEPGVGPLYHSRFAYGRTSCRFDFLAEISLNSVEVSILEYHAFSVVGY